MGSKGSPRRTSSRSPSSPSGRGRPPAPRSTSTTSPSAACPGNSRCTRQASATRDGAEGFVAVFVRGNYAFAASSTKISVEILDARGESAVFDGHTARSEQTLLDGGEDMGYVRFVERRELEESQCVRADGSFTVRCTVSSNREMTRSIAKAAAFSMSDPLRRSPRSSLPEYCTWRKTKSTTRLFAVMEFSSRWARTPAGHALNFKPITFRDSSWRLRLFPAGLEDDATGDSVAVFVSSEMWTILKGTRMSIEILEQSG